MIVEAQVVVAAPREQVWAMIADIEHAADVVSGILSIEILQRPAGGLVGLRWRETRDFFGKPAAVEKEITEAAEGEYYRTRAESDGCLFLATMRVADAAGGTVLSTVHDSRPLTLGTRLMLVPMSLFFKRIARKALLQDLVDIKAALEKQPRFSAYTEG